MSRFRFAAVLRFIALFLATLAACLGAARADDGFLPPGEAFKFESRMAAARTAEVRYTIAPGYYMYRERFAFYADW